MAYPKEVYDAAVRRMAKRREEAEAETAHIRGELYARIPRLKAIRDELAHTALEAVRAVAVGEEGKARIERLKKINLDLQAERAELLTAHHLPIEMLEPKHVCDKCGDTGYVDDHLCDCLRALLREEACKRANSGSPLPLRAFEEFDLSYYPDTPLPGADITVRAYMGEVFTFCRDYAAHFGPGSPSLLLLGGTGLGKTHLALAIANTVLGNGSGAIYDTAQNIFTRMEDETFGRGEKGYLEIVYDCDLLILDELPDYAPPFASNLLYNIINTRTLARRPCIVSTNLSEKELEARYGQKIFSRLIGDFRLLKFFGRDIRQLRLRRNAL